MEIDFTDALIKSSLQKDDKKPNRFHISSLWGIVNGYTSVQEYIEGKRFTAFEVWRMGLGSKKHDLVQELIKDLYDLEVKMEVKEGEIEIVGKADLVAKNKSHVMEIKTSETLYEKAKSWHVYQLQWYLYLLNIPIGYVVQPATKNGRYYLKQIGEVKRPTKVWYNNQLIKINDFYTEVKNSKLWK